MAAAGLLLLSACSSSENSSQGYEGGQGGTPLATGGVPTGAGGLDPSAGGAPAGGGLPGAGGTVNPAGGASGSGGSPNAGGSLGSGGGPGAGGDMAGGGASSGGASAGGAGPDAGPPAEMPPCLSDDSQIVLIGDSYINWVSHTFGADINQVSGLSIENFAIGATSMGSGGIGLIAPQFDTAKATHPDIIAVIMDGGGNDVLVPDTVQFPQGGQCKNMGAESPNIPDCQKIVDKALQAGTDLFLKMAQGGVRDAVFFFYPHVPLNTLVGGTDPNGMLDYALPKIKAACDGAYELSLQMSPDTPIRCHFVDLVPVFEGHPDYFAATDIHPNPTGSRKMAEAIWKKMQDDCVAQPASSGCCMP